MRDTISDRLPRFSLPIGEASDKWTVWLTEDALWSRFNTLSQIAALKGEQREKAGNLFHEIVAGGDVERNEKVLVQCCGFCSGTNCLVKLLNCPTDLVSWRKVAEQYFVIHNNPRFRLAGSGSVVLNR